ncbi:MAG: Asp-tRNA(Asn)/Glu-tRNA(Gln) amidotransferase subunit GatB [Atopobiaceae bacterium]|nr:Asp-tRNA(Asn)/Glu-tRNA(Gln) amidotransferase subunit GatB [Atopobiaceae bacterium]
MRKLEDVLRDWEPVIGLEVHTELTELETTMVCDCRLSHTDAPNTNVCPVCLGMPGALPVPNKQAIRSIVKAGLATGCSISARSMFYRKHYFYPDMAKNFQTTQGSVAFCMHGGLDLELSGAAARERVDDGSVEFNEDGSYTTHVRIQRIHMEEDAAKMVHVGGEEGRIQAATESLIDYNRCGTPLMELVTEPDIRTPEEARALMESLREIFRSLGISDCSLESGSMRADANVSIRRRGETGYGTKCEMKNLNSFRSLHDAIAYEIRRQAELLEDGEQVVQETRHFDVARGRTIAMRSKETADDYRFFPDPDLAPFDLTQGFVDSCAQEIGELPAQRRARYTREFGLRPADARQICAEPDAVALFEGALESSGADGASRATALANLIVNDVTGLSHARGCAIGALGITPAQLAGLVSLLAKDEITAAQGREVLEAMCDSDEPAEAIVDARGMRQTTDLSALEPVVDAVLADCTDQVRQYREGNKRVLGYLVGQCMRASKGSGNPKLFSQLLEKKMGE